MTTAQKVRQTTSQLKKPLNCKKCSALHFEHTLTCKRCGDYLDKRDCVSEVNLGAVKFACAAVGVLIAIVGACVVFHIL